MVVDTAPAIFTTKIRPLFEMYKHMHVVPLQHTHTQCDGDKRLSEQRLFVITDYVPPLHTMHNAYIRMLLGIFRRYDTVFSVCRMTMKLKDVNLVRWTRAQRPWSLCNTTKALKIV